MNRAPLEPLLTVPEVAELLRLSPEHVRRLTRRGDLPGIRLAGTESWKGQWRYDPEEIRRWIDKHRV